MRKVTFLIDEKYADCLSLTCIGVESLEGGTITNITTKAVGIKQDCVITIYKDGTISEVKGGAA